MKINYDEGLMQYALTRRGNLFDYGRYASVPNVSWGLGLDYEADLLCLSTANVFNEIEIKVSKADLKKDKEKKHAHYCRFITRLWFAIPETIDVDFALNEIPEYAGLIQVRPYNKSIYSMSLQRYINKGVGFKTEIVRRPRPKRRKGVFNKPKQETLIKFLRLGVLRMWTDTHRFKQYEEMKWED